jgi:hypothetical protein
MHLVPETSQQQNNLWFDTVQDSTMGRLEIVTSNFKSLELLEGLQQCRRRIHYFHREKMQFFDKRKPQFATIFSGVEFRVDFCLAEYLS